MKSRRIRDVADCCSSVIEKVVTGDKTTGVMMVNDLRLSRLACDLCGRAGR